MHEAVSVCRTDALKSTYSLHKRDKCRDPNMQLVAIVFESRSIFADQEL